ncbi:hypothetical protein NM208_g1169 [Fusarium decemcellulare]|uniref:Uncharacterized protein n=1 Tax=Fusarium decemcellulare TaxID=57161 RepID=A0ACC1SX03_9HYPO|nr:hypothetical protein NM208_g1169 [Fusarium decemcellulare]
MAPHAQVPPLLVHIFQPLMSTWIVFVSFWDTCWAQIPNSDAGQYPSGVVTLMVASWLFFKNSTSALYGVLPQYWLVPGLQTARKQVRDGLRRVECCKKNCYGGLPNDIIDEADKLRRRFADRGIKLEEASKEIVASGCWSFSIMAEASDEDVRRGSELFLSSPVQKDMETQWISEFDCWVQNVNADVWRFRLYGEYLTLAELMDKSVVVKTVDAISVRAGGRRRTMDFRSVPGLLAHSVAASAARDTQRCIAFEAMLIAIWAGVASVNHKGPETVHNTPQGQWANPVLVPASTPKLRAATPPPSFNIAYEPIEAHGLWVYIILIIVARVVISGATALGTSGSLWFAVFIGLYLTNSSAAGSFGRENYDARADCGLICGEGFYMNFSRDTMPLHVKFHDKLESISVIVSMVAVVVIRLFKLRLRFLLGYGAWVPSAPWQMVPGILLSAWASVVYGSELIDNLDRRRPESKDGKFVWYKAFILASCVACVCLGLASVSTAYGEFPRAIGFRWATYGVAEFHSWHVGIYEFGIGKVDGPDMWFAASSTLAAMWGAALLAIAADLGESLF